jgi:membrane-bound serine protease (ClpP class)
MSWIPVYVILVVAGVLLVGVEIYIPGAVVGVIGALALVGAAVVGFVAFPPPWGLFSALGILVMCGAGLVFWIRYFPRTTAGRRLTLEHDGREFRQQVPELQSLVGKEGTADSPLRPSGIALIDGARRDVIADGQFIPAGTRVKVVAMQGNHMIVRSVADAPRGKDAAG